MHDAVLVRMTESFGDWQQEARDDAAFAQEALAVGCQPCELGPEQFDRNDSTEILLLGAIDDAHAAGTDLFEHCKQANLRRRLGSPARWGHSRSFCAKDARDKGVTLKKSPSCYRHLRPRALDA